MLPRALLPLAVLACSSCKDRPELVLHDSEGRAFRAICTKEGPCTLSQTSGPTWPGNRPAAVLRTASRVVGACSVEEGGTVTEAGDCRALVCARDADCPPAHGLPQGTCLSGVCTDQSRTVDADDSIMLCLFGMGLGRDSNTQLERIAIARNCGSPCEVPKVCKQL